VGAPHRAQNGPASAVSAPHSNPGWERIVRALGAVTGHCWPPLLAAVAVSSVVVMGGKPIVRELLALDTGGSLGLAAFNPECHGR
jgi:hypothetical protein